MLVLSRYVGERILVGKDITVQILGVEGTKVRVGVTAPRDVPVFREEVLAKGPDPRRPVDPEEGGNR